MKGWLKMTRMWFEFPRDDRGSKPANGKSVLLWFVVMLFIVALMVALLAIGNTAAANRFPLGKPDCPFGVCMGDPVKPDGGWGTDVVSMEIVETRSTRLPFQKVHIEGTRLGGACRVIAARRYTDAAPSVPHQLRALLIYLYGPPRERLDISPPLRTFTWRDIKNLYNIKDITLIMTSRLASLTFEFTNHKEECSKSKPSTELEIERYREGVDTADAPARTP